MNRRLNKVNIPYLTTLYLLDLFSDHKYPRDKIKNLLDQGELIHIKQGLYLLGPEYGRSYSKEVLAGMIYGPSAISLEYALFYHGLIPERVEVVTSICFKRNKKFRTPIGDFSYRYIASELYSLGIDYVQSEDGNFFIAGPEKAICDLAYYAKIASDDEALDYVLGSLRIDEGELRKLNLSLLFELAKTYKRLSVKCLVDAIILFQKQ
jgi:hypothetical protein